MPSAPAPQTVADRLDDLPFTAKHRRLLLGSGLGWALDAMDVGLVAYVLVALTTQWGLETSTASLIASAGFAGMAIGASLGGLLADRIGRRQVFALTLLIYGVATGAAALSWSVAALVVFRFVVGLGLGAELPVASTLVSEFAPRRIRGRVVVALEAFWAVGWSAAALLGYLLVPTSDDGWRWALAVGAIPAVYAIVVRRSLPESPRFLLSKGRLKEAEEVVASFERSAGRTSPSTALVLGDETPREAPKLFSPELRRRTAGLWIVWFCVNFSYYGAFTWIPTLLVADGYSLIRSLQFTLVITLAQLPGYAVSAVLVEVWGRRRTLAVFLAGSAVAAFLYSQADSSAEVLGAGMFLSFCNLGAWGALYAATPEVYPTAVRARGAGFAAGFGRIASILAPIVVAAVFTASGTGAVFLMLGAAFVAAAAGSFLLPEMRRRALD